MGTTMSGGWLDKAKEAAQRAGEEAKKLAESAKNANYSDMYDKTKAMAKHAADEAKDAASGIMSKDKPNPLTDLDDDQQVTDPAVVLQLCNQRLAAVEKLLQEIKAMLVINEPKS